MTEIQKHIEMTVSHTQQSVLLNHLQDRPAWASPLRLLILNHQLVHVISEGTELRQAAQFTAKHLISP